MTPTKYAVNLLVSKRACLSFTMICLNGSILFLLPCCIWCYLIQNLLNFNWINILSAHRICFPLCWQVVRHECEVKYSSCLNVPMLYKWSRKTRQYALTNVNSYECTCCAHIICENVEKTRIFSVKGNIYSERRIFYHEWKSYLLEYLELKKIKKGMWAFFTLPSIVFLLTHEVTLTHETTHKVTQLMRCK